MVNMKFSISRFFVICFSIFPSTVLGQTLDYETAYKYAITIGRSGVLSACSLGRKYNAVGISYWDPEFVNNRRKEGIEKFGEVNWDIFQSAYAAAMNELCPDVR